MGLALNFGHAFGFHSNDQFWNSTVQSMENAEVDYLPLKANLDVVSEKDEKAYNDTTDRIIVAANKVKTISMIAGYFPILGTIAAIYKLCELKRVENEMKMKDIGKHGVRLSKELGSFIKGCKFRTWVEISSLGALFIIPDLIATLARNFFKKVAVPVSN